VRLLDSRRLTGPNLLFDVPGAIVDVATDDVPHAAVSGAWRDALRAMLDALDWGGEADAARAFPGGWSLAFTAPIDALYAATEVNEWAFAEASRVLRGEPQSDFAGERARLAEVIASERRPALIALAAAANERGLTFLSDDKRVSVGLGTGSRSWPLSRTPASPERVRWNGLHDVPVALVTGTNGKTTTVRLLAEMARAAGRVAGITSTDQVDVGDVTVAVGDYSGPNGARTVLRDRRVELAVLEVARGGILRRGLPVPRAQAALVTNVANDHLGEYGIVDLDGLADAKLVVAKSIGNEGRVVLNADDPRLLARGPGLGRPLTWFTLDPDHPVVAAHVAAGGDACRLEDNELVLHAGGVRQPVIPVRDVPVALGGAARHNVANALAAIGVASALGVPLAAIGTGLRQFDNSPGRNPGRLNHWQIDGREVILDFAHNPHGLAALVATARSLPARRRAIVIGQAGDRDDESIAELTRVAWSLQPDRVFVKEMESYLRGRERGVIPALIAAELRRSGARDEIVSHHDTELEAVQAALAWSAPGDLVVLTVHEDREAVTARLEEWAREKEKEEKAEPMGERRG
jgi:UDP-N-acetylmuramyl tripeptide synthase